MSDATASEFEQLGASVSARRRFLRRFMRQRTALFALGFLVLLALGAVFAPWVAPYDPLAQNLDRVLEAPSLAHWFGTDELGRDVLSRTLFAARISLLAAFQAVLIALVIGVPPGLIAGLAGGRTDNLIMRLTDALMSFPPLILAVAIVAALGPSLTNAMIAVGILLSPTFLRLMRGTAMAVAQETYVEAARSIGCTQSWIIMRHILPNVVSPLFVQISVFAGVAMLAEAGLSFLGLGAQPPDSSWGAMVGRGFRYISHSPSLIVFPGLAIAVTVLAFYVLGDGLRDSLGREIRREE
ncbi:MAG: ABC transporter permease [Gammaproteobacteria bacterium]|nr:MAG: ABC transporter permease [Gammaproteobacteria bacterium]